MYKGTGWGSRLFAASILAASGVAGIFYADIPVSKLWAAFPIEQWDDAGPEEPASAELPVVATPTASAAERIGLIETEPDPGQDYGDDTHPVDERIHFLSAESEARVRAFQIECPQPGKSIRLMDVLRRASAQHSSKRMQLHFLADHRGDAVRITHALHQGDVAVTDYKPWMDLDVWGGWNLHLPYDDPVMNLCWVL